MAITFNPLEGTFDVIVPDTLRSGANPTASVGLAAVNGSATTFLRSDGAPALNVGIVPTWTGIHTFSAEPVFNAGLQLNDDDLITMGTGDDSNLGFDGTNTVLTLVAGSLLIDNTVDQVGIIFRGHSTQTNDITRWQQSNGTVVLEIEDDGTINAGDDAVASDSGHAVYSGTSLKGIFGWDESESEAGIYSAGISPTNRVLTYTESELNFWIGPFTRSEFNLGTYHSIQGYSDNTAGAGVIGVKSRGTIDSPTTALSGDTAFALIAQANYNTTPTFINTGMILNLLTENPSVSAAGNKWVFYTIDNTTTTQDLRMTIDQDGQVTIAQKTLLSGELEIDGALNHDGSTVGFYGTSPISKQTGVAESVAEIHAALVALGLIAA